MYRLTTFLLTAALPAGAYAQSSPPLSDFSLPAPRETATPRAQGPVDDSAPVPVAPRVIAPRPTPSPTPVQRPVIRLPDATSTTAPAAPMQRAPAPQATQLVAPDRAEEQSGAASVGAETQQEAAETLPLPPVPPPLPLPAPQSAPASPSITAAAIDEKEGRLSVWAIGLLAVAAALAAAFWWRRKTAANRPLTIEKPLVGGNAHDANGTPQEPLKIELAAVKLTRSFMNASLAYRITLQNRSSAALTGVTVTGELVAAHGSQPLENQIASPAADLPRLHRLERLAPGQAQTVEGTLALPLSNVISIRQGPAALFVPLLRLVVTITGTEPLARTFVVGLPGQGMAGRLQPFRLDEPPRSYAPVGQRALD